MKNKTENVEKKGGGKVDEKNIESGLIPINSEHGKELLKTLGPEITKNIKKLYEQEAFKYVQRIIEIEVKIQEIEEEICKQRAIQQRSPKPLTRRGKPFVDEIMPELKEEQKIKQENWEKMDLLIQKHEELKNKVAQEEKNIDGETKKALEDLEEEGGEERGIIVNQIQELRKTRKKLLKWAAVEYSREYSQEYERGKNLEHIYWLDQNKIELEEEIAKNEIENSNKNILKKMVGYPSATFKKWEKERELKAIVAEIEDKKTELIEKFGKVIIQILGQKNPEEMRKEHIKVSQNMKNEIGARVEVESETFGRLEEEMMTRLIQLVGIKEIKELMKETAPRIKEKRFFTGY